MPARPVMPRDYRIRTNAKGLLPWTYVEARMSASHNYWVSTTRPDGRPHAMPVWGVWIDRTFYFGTDRRSRKGRNLAQQPAVTVHLESGDEVVIVEGVAGQVTDASRLAKIDDAYNSKYGMRVVGHPGDTGIFAVSPRTVFAWREKDLKPFTACWNARRSHTFETAATTKSRPSVSRKYRKIVFNAMPARIPNLTCQYRLRAWENGTLAMPPGSFLFLVTRLALTGASGVDRLTYSVAAARS